MLLIFDWDGTLVDSRDEIVRALQAAISELALPPRSDQDCANIIGLGLAESVEVLYPGLDAAQAQAMARSYSKHFLAQNQHLSDNQYFPGAQDILATLRARGHQLAVATGKSRRGLDRVLARGEASSWFVATRTADETASKPNPLMLNELLAETGVEAGSALMIGDTSYDMEMAQQAGIARVAVSYGVHEPARLANYSPLAVIDELQQLLQLDCLG